MSKKGHSLAQRQKSMNLLLKGVQEHEQFIRDAVHKTKTGWYRLCVKLEDGEVVKVQLIADQEINLDTEQGTL